MRYWRLAAVAATDVALLIRGCASLELGDLTRIAAGRMVGFPPFGSSVVAFEKGHRDGKSLPFGTLDVNPNSDLRSLGQWLRNHAFHIGEIDLGAIVPSGDGSADEGEVGFAVRVDELASDRDDDYLEVTPVLPEYRESELVVEM